MQLVLKSVGQVRGCYGPNRDQFPARAAYLAPDVADAFVAMLDGGPSGPGIGRDRIAFSDMWRSGESSLAAVVAGRGAQAPGFSGHNFGVSLDVDVAFTCRALGSAGRPLPYTELLALLARHGWHCYRRDGGRGPEEWHFNYLGVDAPAVLGSLTRATWAGAAESAILKRYPASTFALGPADMQAALKKLGLYHGDVDGKFGPLSMAAAGAFARAWRLPDGRTDGRFARTLAFVSADITKDVPDQYRQDVSART